MRVKDIEVPNIDKMEDIATAIGQCFGRKIEGEELVELRDLAADLDLLAWECNSVCKSGILIGLAAGMRAGMSLSAQSVHAAA